MQQMFGVINHYIQDEGCGHDIICALWPVNSGENTDVLAFITGCPTVPPIGFQPEPSINFQNESPFPRANTCIRDNILRVHGLEMAPVTIKMVETIIVMPCCVGKSRQPNSTIPFC